jgi:hypothetical protein
MDLFYAHLALRVLLSLRERIEVRAIIVKAISLNRSQRPIKQAPAPARLYDGPEIDPRRDNGQRCRAELEHGLSPRAAVAEALACQGSVETLNR